MKPPSSELHFCLKTHHALNLLANNSILTRLVYLLHFILNDSSGAPPSYLIITWNLALWPLVGRAKGWGTQSGRDHAQSSRFYKLYIGFRLAMNRWDCFFRCWHLGNRAVDNCTVSKYRNWQFYSLTRLEPVLLEDIFQWRGDKLYFTNPDTRMFLMHWPYSTLI